MILGKQLHKLSVSDFDLKNKKTLVDIKTVSIDAELNKPDRIIQYINAVHNPYLFRVGETAVRVRYGKENCTLQESVANFFISQ